jgi:hypothetical protein
MSVEAYRWDRARLRRAVQIVSWATAALLLLLLAAFIWLEGWLSLKMLLVALAAGLTTIRVKLMENEKDRKAPLRMSNDGLWVKAWGVGVLPWNEIISVQEGPGSWVRLQLRDPKTVLARAGGMQGLLLRALALIGRGPFAIDCSLLAGSPRQVAASIRRWQAEADHA